jgi:hypothetical protein
MDGYVLTAQGSSFWQPQKPSAPMGSGDLEWGFCRVAEKEDEFFGDLVPHKTYRPKVQLMRLTSSDWGALETHRTFYCAHWKKVSLKVLL